MCKIILIVKMSVVLIKYIIVAVSSMWGIGGRKLMEDNKETG